jgi:excisionase family DNA binding protein
MPEDRFVSEVVSKAAAIVIRALRTEGLALSGDRVRNSSTSARITPKLVRVEDAAIMLARTKKSIRGLIYRGELKVVRHGRAVRIAVDDLLKFIARGRSPRVIKLCRSNCKRKRG